MYELHKMLSDRISNRMRRLIALQNSPQTNEFLHSQIDIVSASFVRKKDLQVLLLDIVSCDLL